MRDETIVQRFQMLSECISNDVHALQRGISMVRTRQDAVERLLFSSRCGILKAVLLQLLSPKMLKRSLEALHSDEIYRYNENRKKANQAAAVKPAPQVGLLTVH